MSVDCNGIAAHMMVQTGTTELQLKKALVPVVAEIVYHVIRRKDPEAPLTNIRRADAGHLVRFRILESVNGSEFRLNTRWHETMVGCWQQKARRRRSHQAIAVVAR